MEKVKIGKIAFFVDGPDAPFLKDFWVLVKNNKWEKDTYRIFDEFLDKSHSYLDIGAWIGPTVLYGCQLAKRCYAIEPDVVSFRILLNNINLNPSLKNKIFLYNGCISNVSGNIRLGTKTHFGDSMSSILFSDQKEVSTVKSLTLDEFMLTRDIKDCNFIKIDIEGGEVLVLPNIKAYLQENMPTIFLSLHPFLFKDKEKDSRAILEVLKIYKNIYYSDGRRLQLEQLLDVLLSINEITNFSIVATNKWDYHKRLFYLYKTYKSKINVTTLKRLLKRILNKVGMAI